MTISISQQTWQHLDADDRARVLEVTFAYEHSPAVLAAFVILLSAPGATFQNGQLQARPALALDFLEASTHVLMPNAARERLALRVLEAISGDAS